MPVINTPTTPEAPSSTMQVSEQCNRDTALDRKICRKLKLQKTAKRTVCCWRPLRPFSVASDNLDRFCLLHEDVHCGPVLGLNDPGSSQTLCCLFPSWDLDPEIHFLVTFQGAQSNQHVKRKWKTTFPSPNPVVLPVSILPKEGTSLHARGRC